MRREIWRWHMYFWFKGRQMFNIEIEIKIRKMLTSFSIKHFFCVYTWTIINLSNTFFSIILCLHLDNNQFIKKIKNRREGEHCIRYIYGLYKKHICVIIMFIPWFLPCKPNIFFLFLGITLKIVARKTYLLILLSLNLIFPLH